MFTQLFLLLTLHVTVCSANTTPEITIMPIPFTTATVSENAAIGSIVAVVKVHDPSSGANDQFTCSLSGSDFVLESVDNNQGMYNIKTAVYLDREVYPYYEVTVRCIDQSDDSFFHEQSLTIQVEDVNDNGPQFPRSESSIRIDENTKIGDTVFRVEAMDHDTGENGRLIYGLDADAQDFLVIDKATGDIAIKPALIDRRIALPRSFRVYVADRGTPIRTAEAYLNFIFSGQNC